MEQPPPDEVHNDTSSTKSQPPVPKCVRPTDPTASAETSVSLRKDFLLNEKCNMLVLVSMATDEMIRLVSMYPEVWFMDTTAGECI
jgi:hypothetical protein